MAGDHKTDGAKWRATFGIAYPTDETEITHDNPDKSITGQRVRFSLSRKTLKGVSFVTCQFFILPPKPGAEGPSQDSVTALTFKGCHFDRTFLGGVSFLDCRFVDCTFYRCDFGNTKFVDCEFSDCRFDECTSWETVFLNTVIDAGAFLKGQCVPLDNFRGAPDGIAEARMKFVRFQAGIAGQLVRSLADGSQSDFYDAALYYSKWYGYLLRRMYLADWGRYRLLTRSWGGAVGALVRDLARVAFARLNLLLTKGGTSVVRLLIIFLIVNVALFPCLVLPHLSLTYAGKAAYCQHAEYHEWVASSVEMFLVYGYTNYTPQSVTSHLWVASFACAGLVWYAFLIPVLLRRVYK